jgi:hypothetical protein
LSFGASRQAKSRIHLSLSSRSIAGVQNVEPGIRVILASSQKRSAAISPIRVYVLFLEVLLGCEKLFGDKSFAQLVGSFAEKPVNSYFQVLARCLRYVGYLIHKEITT